MATTDRFGTEEHAADRPPREANLAWLSDPATWFASAVIGMVIVFGGLAIDAYRHNNGAGEESLLSFSNPGHLVAGIGLVIVSLSVLAGMSVSMLKGATTVDSAIRRFVPVTAAWTLLAVTAISSVTYIGASGVTVGHSGSHDTASSTTEASDGTGIAKALQEEGIDPAGQEATSGETNIDNAKGVEGALTQGASGHAGGAHDNGKQPTFTQMVTLSDEELMPLFPAGTVTKDNVGDLRDQVKQVREVALRLDTPEKAVAAGYSKTTGDVPFMGEHYLNFGLVRDGIFDPSQPEGLLFSKIDGGGQKLVGVWFLQLPGIGGVKREVEPAGFASDLDLWHAHVGLCLVGFSGASEGETRESCTEKGGNFTADLRWMMHVWVAPETTENPEGIMAYLNNDLYEKQTAAKNAAEAPAGVTP